MNDVLIEGTGSTGILRLNRPTRGNSVTPEVVTTMANAVREMCDTDSIDAIVLTGTGPVFCAGADVQEMYAVFVADGADGLMTYLADVWMPGVQELVRTIWAAPKPVVAAYNGTATAGGLDFGLACDMRVASSDARFAESYINLGMVPVAGGMYLLPLLVGMPAATKLIASGEFIDAARAEQLKLVDQVTDPENVLQQAIELAEKLASGPSASFAAIKRIVRLTAGRELDEALQESLMANVQLIGRADVRARILAVMERYSVKRSRVASAG